MSDDRWELSLLNSNFNFSIFIQLKFLLVIYVIAVTSNWGLRKLDQILNPRPSWCLRALWWHGCKSAGVSFFWSSGMTGFRQICSLKRWGDGSSWLGESRYLLRTSKVGILEWDWAPISTKVQERMIRTGIVMASFCPDHHSLGCSVWKGGVRSHVLEVFETISLKYMQCVSFLSLYVFQCVSFLLDPGVPGVRSMGPGLSMSLQDLWLRLCWCDSGWCWYQLDASWWCQ